MNCFLLFCLSNVYLEAGVGYIQPTPAPPAAELAKLGSDILWKYDANFSANPMARLAVGHEWNPSPQFRISLELRHESWLATTADHGQNSAWVSARVLPWR